MAQLMIGRYTKESTEENLPWLAHSALTQHLVATCARTYGFRAEFSWGGDYEHDEELGDFRHLVIEGTGDTFLKFLDFIIGHDVGGASLFLSKEEYETWNYLDSPIHYFSLD